jgi:hypothetical protein
MPTFEGLDIVSVPCPYTDRPVRERRPAAGEIKAVRATLSQIVG